MTSLYVCRFAAHAVVATALMIGMLSGPARGAAIVTTGDGSNQVLVYPTPNQDTPNPTAIPVSGMPAGAHPHGVSCFDDTCLISDKGNFRIFVVQVSSRSVVDTIGTGGVLPYSGDGTIAVNPAQT